MDAPAPPPRPAVGIGPPPPPPAPGPLYYRPEEWYALIGAGVPRARARMGEGRFKTYEHNVELDKRHADPAYSEEADESLPLPPKKYKDFPSFNPTLRKDQTECEGKEDEEECAFRLTEDGGEIWDPELLTKPEDVEHIDVPEDGFEPVVEPFDVRQLGDDFTYAFLGKRREGKSFCARYLCYHMRHLFPRVYIFTNTKINGYWQKMVPSKYVSYSQQSLHFGRLKQRWQLSHLDINFISRDSAMYISFSSSVKSGFSFKNCTALS